MPEKRLPKYVIKTIQMWEQMFINDPNAKSFKIYTLSGVVIAIASPKDTLVLRSSDLPEVEIEKGVFE